VATVTEPLSIVIRLLKEESPYRWNEETGEWDFVPPQDKPSDPLDYFTGFSPDKWSDKVEGETNEQFHQRMDYSCPCGSGKTPQPNALFGGEDRCFGCIAEKTTPLVQQMFTAPTIHVEPKYNAEGHPVRSAAYGYDFRTKNAGEPMDIALRLLKGSNDPPYDPDNPYWQDPNWKNYVDPDPRGAFGIPQSTWDEIAARQEEEGNKVQTPQEIAMEVFNERTENVYDSPDTHCQLHGERLQPIVDPQSIRQFPKGADENMYCTACEQNITNEPRQPQQFDIDEDTRRKLTGEPMDIAFQLLKAKSKGQESLTEWTKEKWEFVGDDKKEMKKPRHKRGRYAPKSVADSMSPSQKATENKTKRAAHKKGKQHAPRGKSVKQMYRSVEGKK